MPADLCLVLSISARPTYTLLVWLTHLLPEIRDLPADCDIVIWAIHLVPIYYRASNQLILGVREKVKWRA